MRPPVLKDYTAEVVTEAITDDAAPPASSALLLAAIGWPEALNVTPYCGTGHQFDALGSASVETRYLGILTPVAAVHCRAALSRGWTPGVSATSSYHEAATSDGGMTGNDVVRVLWYVTPAGVVPVGGFSGLHADIAVSGATLNDAPAAPMDRLFEVQTLGAPYVEPWMVTKVGGFSVVVSDLLADLETL
jgi:hypothetical protein